MGTVPLRAAPAQGQAVTTAKEEALPVRPYFVAERNKNAVQLHANYFPLDADKIMEVSKYTFTVLGGNKQEDEIKGASARQIFELALAALQVSPGEHATDNKQQLVTLSPLKLPNDKRQPTVEGRIVKFDDPVQVRLDTLVSGSPSQDVIDCLNLITDFSHVQMKNSAKKISETCLRHPIQRCYLFREDSSWACVQPFNVNVTFGVFRPHGQIKLLYGLLKDRHEFDKYPRRRIGVMSELHEAISRARVYYSPPGLAKVKADDSPPRTVPIAGFARKTDLGRDKSHPLQIDTDFPGPEQVRFWFKEGERGAFRTVNHLQQRHGVTIDSALPLINKGRPNKPDYVPAEYCELQWGQHLRLKVTEIPGLSETDLQNLNQFTCRGPEHNQQWIKSVGSPSHMDFEFDRNLFFQNFHVRVRNSLLPVTGRELSAPTIGYTETEQIRPKDGAWLARAGRPFKRGTLRSWTWIYFGGPVNHLKKDLFDGIKELQRHLERVCEQCPEPEALQSRCINMTQGITILNQELGRAKAKGVQLVVLIFPSRITLEVYNQVKFIGDIRHGIHTCCVLRKQVSKASWSYFANVALKINLKLGGINHRLFKLNRLFQGVGTMVVGYDVTHPTGSTKESPGSKPGEDGAGKSASKGPNEAQSQISSEQAQGSKDSKKEHSQVGLVASVSHDLGQWSSCYWNQAARLEMNDTTITQTFVSRLQAWTLSNGGNLPDKIVIYRDGVSESQFEQVLKEEVPKIRKACSQLQNRRGQHQTGTIVDRDVTQNRYWEFFLAAHAAIKGTTKPTRYVVVLDEIFRDDYSKNGAEELELFTHNLSYVYGRANRAVSVCTPAYYADILCTRARAYTSALENDRFKSDIKESISGDPKANSKQIMEGNIHPDLENSMYWI